MNKRQKTTLLRILLSAALFVAAFFIPLEGVTESLYFIAIYAIIGWDVLAKAIRNILNGQVFDENFLMAIATLGAFIIGKYDEGVEVMLFYQVGELFQSYAVGRSRQSIAALMDIRPDYANIENQMGDLIQVDPEEVKVGDIIVIKAGEKIPLDGVVLEGHSALNTAALTGESLPRDVAPGENVISGCINQTGLLRVRVSKEFGESTVAKILDLVENSSSKKAKAENFITKFARYYTPAVVIGAALLAVIPPLFFQGAWAEWVERGLIFLVISCPCALVISIPLSFFGGIGGASKRGILVKGSNYLEALAETETVVFDKTGTLTKGTFQVTHILPMGDFTQESLLETAALAECYSNHPISLSLKDAYGATPDSTRVSEVEEIAGHGVKALVDGRPVAAGNGKLMNLLSIPFETGDEIGTIIHLAVDGSYAGRIVIADEAKADSAAAIASLKRQGIKTVMLTGDSDKVGRRVAAELGLDEVHTELLPGDKVEEVERLLAAKSPKGKLAFVGDGINDAPVLSRADIGIAMGGLGSDAAIEAADIVLMDDAPSKIATAMAISRKTLVIVKQNIVFALGVKALVLFLGAIGLANMQAAVFADVGVAVIAILNATRALNSEGM